MEVRNTYRTVVRKYGDVGIGWMSVQGLLIELDVFTALRFKGTGAPLAEEHMLIFPMTQHADNIWNEGKFLLLFTDHRRCCKRSPSSHK
jgi:hypothetical protein